MNTRPEKDALEQRLRQMAESLEVPSALSPENLLRKLPERRASPKIQLRRYSSAAALAACLLLVITSSMLLRNFSGNPVIHPESSVSVIDESSRTAESSSPAQSSEPEENLVSSQMPESSLPTEESSSASSIETPPPENNQTPSNPAVEESVPESGPSNPAAENPLPEDSPATEEESSDPPAKIPDQSLSEAYQDIYNAISAMDPSAVLDAPSTFSISPRAASSLATIEGAETPEIVKADGSLLCSLETFEGESLVRIYRLLGRSSTLATELRPEVQLPVFQGLYLAYTDYLGLYLQDNLMILLGSAQYISEKTDYSQNVSLSFAVFYDLSNPKSPRQVSTLAQEGAFLASAVQNGQLTLFSQHSLFQQNLIADEVESYVPALYCNGNVLLPDPSRIQVGQAPNSPVYSCIGLIDLNQPMEFADSLFYLGGSDGLFLEGELFCTNQLTSDKKTLLTLFSSENGLLTMRQEYLLEGTLLGNAFIDQSSRTIRAAVLKEDGNMELTLFNDSLEKLADITVPTDHGVIVSLEHKAELTCFYDEAGGMTAVDCTWPRQPKLLSRQESAHLTSSSNKGTFPYGNKGLFQAETVFQNEKPVLQISVTQFGKAPVTLLLPGDIDADFFYDSESLMLESHLGLIGFSAAVYSENGEREHIYFLLRYNAEDGLQLIGQYRLPAGDYSRGFLKNGNVYVSAPGGLLAIDAGNGNVLAE